MNIYCILYWYCGDKLRYTYVIENTHDIFEEYTFMICFLFKQVNNYGQCQSCSLMT
jgi:hypothetical protein